MSGERVRLAAGHVNNIYDGYIAEGREVLNTCTSSWVIDVFWCWYNQPPHHAHSSSSPRQHHHLTNWP